MKFNLYTLAAWIFLALLFPFILIGVAVAIMFFSALIGYKTTAKILQAWSDKCSE